MCQGGFEGEVCHVWVYEDEGRRVRLDGMGYFRLEIFLEVWGYVDMCYTHFYGIRCLTIVMRLRIYRACLNSNSFIHDFPS